MIALTYILLERGRTTAEELAAHFGVSTRTIYRDINTLVSTGVPIRSDKGRGGGIELQSEKMLTPAREPHARIAAGSDCSKDAEASPALEKLAAMFGKTDIPWLEVFYIQGGSSPRSTSFEVLREAILSRRVVHFSYCGEDGARVGRLVEPLKIFFRNYRWYLYGYCRQSRGCEVYSLVKIRGVVLTGEVFERETPDNISFRSNAPQFHMRLRIAAAAVEDVYEKFSSECIAPQQDGGVIVSLEVPREAWVYSLVLSYGENAEVLSPPFMRETMGKTAAKVAKLYDN